MDSRSTAHERAQFTTVLRVTLTREDVVALNNRARIVGRQIGCELRFEADINPEGPGLTAGTRHVFIFGPLPTHKAARQQFEDVLDALQTGRRRIANSTNGPNLV